MSLKLPKVQKYKMSIQKLENTNNYKESDKIFCY